LFSRHFLYLLLVNLLLLASLEERSIYRKLDCFFRAEDKKLTALEDDSLADKTTRNVFTF